VTRQGETRYSRAKSKLLGDIKLYRGLILEGRLLSIDPSCGSSSSLPGYAIYEQGKLIESGVINVTLSHNLNARLKGIGEVISQFPDIDITVVEEVPSAARGWQRSVTGHASLLKAVGMCIACSPSPYTISVDARIVAKYRPDGYVKSDEEDAKLIGAVAIKLAGEVEL